jgi:hypothetical protein
VDAISVLKDDHKLFRRLLREFDATTERAHAPNQPPADRLAGVMAGQVDWARDKARERAS